MRNLLATLLLAQGTPMMLAGDEFARTQQGNNNAYCQDNEISWVDWSLHDTNADLVQFVRKLTALRHKYPILRRNLFLNGEYLEELGVRDVTWLNPAGAQMTEEDWDHPEGRCFGMLLDGRAQATGIRQRGKEATILIVVNGYHEPSGFTLPGVEGGGQWSLLIDTQVAAIDEPPAFAIGAPYDVTARSLLVFVLEAEPAPSVS
jgi:glycogen operon protein